MRVGFYSENTEKNVEFHEFSTANAGKVLILWSCEEVSKAS
jgi:hypothetical protein